MDILSRTESQVRVRVLERSSTASCPSHRGIESPEVRCRRGHVLKITAESETLSRSRFGYSHFTQVLTLPGSVQSAKMKGENENGNVVITLPQGITHLP